MAETTTEAVAPLGPVRPWPALWALVIGFFMVLMVTTVVQVATPRIMVELNADLNSAIWVTSAYLIAFAVPLLVTGRLGDRFGLKRIYIAGLVVFTGASAWCGFASSIEMLIVARVFQGIGGALLTPQTMAVITRIFPARKRGAAMGIWAAAGGVASLVGPILGGVVVDALGWEWTFFINVPIGVVALVLAVRLVPTLPTHKYRVDVLGGVLSAAGVFLVVFTLQEGEQYHWGTITGPIGIWSLLVAGLVLLGIFVSWQAINKSDPLVPLALFRDRNFSLATVIIAAMGLAVTALSLPLVYYFQLARGMTPTRSALMLAPMGVLLGVLSPLAGVVMRRVAARLLVPGSFVAMAVSLFWYSGILTADVDLAWLLLPSALLGIANAGIWGPVTATATANLPPDRAGVGAGIYNTMRQIGAVLGSACIATVLQNRLTANLPPGVASGSGGLRSLPEALRPAFSAGMGQSLLFPAGACLVAAVLACFFLRPTGGAAHDTSGSSGRIPQTGVNRG
ncbi:DHA2 family efflux MFS transporter permease subunit [Pseudonocardia phyllosphaerae]|uniref:DHA2 family efflux MFS transporter permease subunit n=1 Tax=Pseudonocardia phyllosphaerae TaxID=3390502 RepID=UPI00397ADF5C